MGYDVVVVGAGAAGAPLAARLSEDPDRRVLLLEAGPDAPAGFPPDLLDAALLPGAVPGHPATRAHPAHLTPDRPYSVVRGRVLGGSTTVNGGYFVRARDTDFARWAAAGNPEWAPERVLPYYRRLEDDAQYGATEQHGAGGPVPVRRELTSPAAWSPAFAAACAELGFPEDADKNDMRVLEGHGPLPQNVVDGVRVNAGLAYLHPVRAARPNLTVRGGSRVLRVLFDGARAVGVLVERGGVTEEVHADEVLLAGGAVDSAHLLLLSGIGPAGVLTAAGIPVRVDAPGVGAAFSDHPHVLVTVRPTRRLDDPHARQLFGSVLHWTAAGSATPGDLEVLPMLRPLARAQGGEDGSDDLGLLVAVQRPESRGTLTVASADPHRPPRIDYHHLDQQRDRTRMREGVRTVVRLLRTDALRGLVSALPGLEDRVLEDDAALDTWVLGHLGTAVHMAGTAPMGPATDPGAAVDQLGRVRGVPGLRVADTSVLPDVPSRGPAATAVMIGEKMADLVSGAAPPP